MRVLYAEKVGDHIETNATFADKEPMRQIPGSTFHNPPPVWSLKLSWSACKQLRGTFGDRLQIGPELAAWAQAEIVRRVQPAMDLRFRADDEGLKLPLPLPPGRELLPFQTPDVLWCLAAGSGLLTNPTGAGKTVVALTWLRNMAIDRAVVFCKTAKKLDWAEECELWYPELEPIVVTGSAKERRELIQEAGRYGGLCIVGLEVARTHSRLAPYGSVALTQAEKTPKDLNFEAFEAAICDEAHRLADPKSKWTRAVWSVGHQDSVEHRLAMTATETTKGLDTIWSALHFADPVEWPSRSKFIERYVEVFTDFWGGKTYGVCRPQMEEEWREIFEPRSRHLPKEVVLPHLPKMERAGSKKAAATGREEYPWKVREVEMTKEQAAAYRQMTELSLAELRDGEVIAVTNAAAQYVRLGQFASSCAYLGEPKPVRDRKTGETVMRRPVELELPSNKIAAFLDDLEDWQKDDDPVIAFASSRKLLKLLASQLDKKKVPYSAVWGGQTEMERHEDITRFRTGQTDLILVVISAGGEGLNLQRARVGAVLQRSWARWEDIQMEGRWQRPGSEQYESLLRVDYVSPGTVDVGQLDVLDDKDEVLESVHQTKETIARIMRGGHPRPKEEDS